MRLKKADSASVLWTRVGEIVRHAFSSDLEVNAVASWQVPGTSNLRAVTELLRHSLARLSPEHGEVIDLLYFHGKSVKEVAEIVGIATATVKTRMFCARKKLADFVASA
jgi:DNA-directed RNA polymerase specialized sigma24 family protein